VWIIVEHRVTCFIAEQVVANQARPVSPNRQAFSCTLDWKWALDKESGEERGAWDQDAQEGREGRSRAGGGGGGGGAGGIHRESEACRPERERREEEERFVKEGEGRRQVTGERGEQEKVFGKRGGGGAEEEVPHEEVYCQDDRVHREHGRDTVPAEDVWEVEGGAEASRVGEEPVVNFLSSPRKHSPLAIELAVDVNVSP
jgi:hypothetical protein